MSVTEVNKYGSHDRAKELVMKCVGEAKVAGLTLADMEIELSRILPR